MYVSVLVTPGLGRPLVPWTIIQVSDEQRTFEGFFQSLQAGRLDVPVTDDLKKAKLIRTSVGAKADTPLMVTSVSQTVCGVCGQFGNYIKFIVEVSDEPEPGQPDMLPNAFSIMMASQRRLQLGDNGLPFPKVVKDSRDRLYNDLITLLRGMGISWNDPLSNGVPLLQCLQKVLWYIDGHQDTMAEKVPKIPDVFSQFTGYNCPTAHKHRKRLIGNLSRSELREHALALQDKLQSSWFKKDSFSSLKEAIED